MSKNTRFVLKHVRLSYPCLVNPEVNNNTTDPNAKPKYAATFLMEKGGDNEKLLRAKLMEALKEKAPESKKWCPAIRTNDMSKYFSLEARDGWPLRDGDTKDTAGYEGMSFVKATNISQPFTIDQRNCPKSASEFYAGCYVDAAVEAYVYNLKNSSTFQVGLALAGVKFSEDGDAFGAGPIKATDYFGEPEDTFDSDDPNAYNI